MKTFKKGDYVVLLSSCTGKNCWEEMPENYCYQLNRDYDSLNFYIEKDIKGGFNGWGVSTVTLIKHPHVGFLRVRGASKWEIEQYNNLGKPFKTTSICLDRFFNPIKE